MFENSFVTRINLRCPIHYNNKITHACPKPNCQGNSLLCEQCLNSKIKQQHYGHQYQIQKIDSYLSNLSGILKREKPSIQKLYKSILSQKQNQTLLKWQQQKQQHFQSIQNHLNTLKFQIQEQMRNIIQKFEDQLNKQRQNIYKQLDNYFETYKNKFNHFSQLSEPVVKVSQSFIFYQSKNNLTLKLMSVESGKVSKWLNGLKFNLNRAELATKKEGEYINRVQTLGLVTNELMDELPRLRSIQFQGQLSQIMRQSSKRVLCALVSLRRGKGIQKSGGMIGNSIGNIGHNHIVRSTSMNYISNEHSRTTSVNNNNNSNNSNNTSVNMASRQRKYVGET